MKKNYMLLLAVALTAILSLLISCNKKKEAPTKLPDIDVAEAIIDSVVIYQTYPGQVMSGQTVNVMARVNAEVKKVCFADGSYVNKGDVLFLLDPVKYSSQVQTALATLSTAESQYSYYCAQYKAMTQAFQADAVSKMEVLQAKSNMEQAAAAISNAKAQLRSAQINLGYCTVTAPISGYVTTPQVTAGNTAYGEGSPVVLTTIYDNSNMLAKFSLSDSQYEKLINRIGGIKNTLYRNVPLHFREPLPHKYTTDLYYSAPTVNESTGTILIQGSLENHDNELKNGMYVTVSLPVGTNPRAILVKDAAISTDQRGKFLYTVTDSDKIVYTPIETGELYHDTLRIVTKGISGGERYVTKALLTTRPGERIHPVLTH